MSDAYYSVATIKVKPGKLKEAYAAIQEVSAITEKEPGALLYRYYKVEGEDKFVFIEGFSSTEAYASLRASDPIQQWVGKYLGPNGLFDGKFDVYKSDPSPETAPGGFNREK